MTAPNAWLAARWLQVPQPRDMSAIFAGLYAIAFATGLLAILDPPDAIVAMQGRVVMILMGILLLAGAGSAALGGYLTLWQLERVGIVICSLALACYGYLVLAAHVQSEGSKMVQVGIVLMALAAFVIRYRMIRGFTYKPRG